LANPVSSKISTPSPSVGRARRRSTRSLAVEVVLVPGHGGEQPLEALLGGAGDDLGDGVAVLVGVLGQEAGEVAFQGLRPLAPLEVDAGGGEELGQVGQRCAGGVRDSGGLHPLSTHRDGPRFK
jgi:hypothetical protein